MAVTSHSMSRRQAVWALAFLVPVPSLGTLAAMVVWPGQSIGQLVFAVAKGWILVFPLFWWWRVENRRTPQPLHRPTARALLEGLASGLVLAAVIVAVYKLWGTQWVDPVAIRDQVKSVGLGSPVLYLTAALYWCLVNALLEEYVWRWFVTRQFRYLCRGLPAILFAALAFTLHHVFALATLFPWQTVFLASAGIAIGGLIWSDLYLRHQNLWPAYCSHVLVDIAVFGLGYDMIQSATG